MGRKASALFRLMGRRGVFRVRMRLCVRECPPCGAPNVILTPHVAFATAQSMVVRAEMVFENVRCYLDGSPRNLMK